MLLQLGGRVSGFPIFNDLPLPGMLIYLIESKTCFAPKATCNRNTHRRIAGEPFDVDLNAWRKAFILNPIIPKVPAVAFGVSSERADNFHTGIILTTIKVRKNMMGFCCGPAEATAPGTWPFTNALWRGGGCPQPSPKFPYLAQLLEWRWFSEQGPWGHGEDP